MADATIISEMPIGMGELKQKLEATKKKEKELNYRANKTLEYLQQLSINQNSQKMVDELRKLQVPRLKDQHIYKIIDILPTTVDDLKLILQAYTISVNNDNLKKIVDVINKGR